jgi:glycosyltransferase involved in cell wall biosynthesis
VFRQLNGLSPVASPPKPLVTIGIPTYNRASGYLREALESALAQTYPNIEIVVADNCSPDNTRAVVESYADARIRYFRHDPGLKPNDNFNFCLQQARGDYFLMLHDDDMVDSDFVASCMEAADCRSDVGVLRTGTRIIDARGAVLGEAPNHAVGLSTTEFFLAWFAGATALYICSTLYNTRWLREIGGFRSRHNLFQDDVAGLTLAARYGRVDVSGVKASFRVHGAELTKASRVADWCEDSLDLLQLMCDLAPERKEEVRKRGMLFFAGVNYSRASHVTPLSKRFSTVLFVFRRFGYRHLPPWRLFLGNTALYRGLRSAKRRLLGLPILA